MSSPAWFRPHLPSSRRQVVRGRGAMATWSFFLRLSLSLGIVLAIGLALASAARPVLAQECPARGSGPPPSIPSPKDVVNPNPSTSDFELPMPCGEKLILRHVCVPSKGYFGDLLLSLGCHDCGRPNLGFMEARRPEAVSGSFTFRDLPHAWRTNLIQIAKTGDGSCPAPNAKTTMAFYYFIGKYEISNFQWRLVMDGKCPKPGEPPGPDDPRPKTGISWFEAVDFTRRYTEWLLENSPKSLPRFARGRFGYVRLPTEAEWEYAARGGHLASESQLNDEEIFPLDGRPLADYAVFTTPAAAKPPEKLAWIGSKCANPLGLFDTAGNAAEMVLDPFHFSVGTRLHGATGGFVVKGGSFRKSKGEIMPGRREEMPFFLADGAFRSKDLGFRVVLSAIITPDNRQEFLRQEWAIAAPRAPGSTHQGPPPVISLVELDQSSDPIEELDRLASLSISKVEKKNLHFLRDLIKNARLEEQKGEKLKGLIWSALFAAESVLRTTVERKIALGEISRLKSMKNQAVPESVLEGLDRDIATARGSISRLDGAIDGFAQVYLDRIRESQDYPEDVLETQIDNISQELNIKDGFSQNLKTRLEVFKKHVALYKSKSGSIAQSVLLDDIVPPSLR